MADLLKIANQIERIAKSDEMDFMKAFILIKDAVEDAAQVMHPEGISEAMTIIQKVMNLYTTDPTRVIVTNGVHEARFPSDLEALLKQYFDRLCNRTMASSSINEETGEQEFISEPYSTYPYAAQAVAAIQRICQNVLANPIQIRDY